MRHDRRNASFCPVRQGRYLRLACGKKSSNTDRVLKHDHVGNVKFRSRFHISTICPAMRPSALIIGMQRRALFETRHRCWKHCDYAAEQYSARCKSHGDNCARQERLAPKGRWPGASASRTHLPRQARLVLFIKLSSGVLLMCASLHPLSTT